MGKSYYEDTTSSEEVMSSWYNFWQTWNKKK